MNIDKYISIIASLSGALMADILYVIIKFIVVATIFNLLFFILNIESTKTTLLIVTSIIIIKRNTLNLEYYLKIIKEKNEDYK